MAEEINWDEAVSSSGFVRLETDKEKRLTLTNFELNEVEKFGEKNIEFSADVLEEDGEPVKEKKFTATSRRLKKKLRPIFENKDPTSKVKLSILKVGEQFSTQYSVKEITE